MRRTGLRVMVFFSIHPVGEGEHVGDAMSTAVSVIRESGLEHDVGPSGTTILGEWDEVFKVVHRCHEILGAQGARLSSLIKVDWKRGMTPGSIKQKVGRVSPSEGS